MNIHASDEGSKSFEYSSTHLGFTVEVVINWPTDERIANRLHFLDVNQLFPLLPYIKQTALKFAQGDPDRANALTESALNWFNEQSQNHEYKAEGAEVLDAAFEMQRQVYKDWWRKNLLPLVNKREIINEVHSAISTALINFERIKLEEFAEKVNYTLRTSLQAPDGTYQTKTVRGRRFSIFKANLGRTRGSKNTEPKVTYEKIVREIRRFKGNDYGILPSRAQIAKKLRCDQKTITTRLRENGERRRFPTFVRALLEQE